MLFHGDMVVKLFFITSLYYSEFRKYWQKTFKINSIFNTVFLLIDPPKKPAPPPTHRRISLSLLVSHLPQELAYLLGLQIMNDKMIELAF